MTAAPDTSLAKLDRLLEGSYRIERELGRGAMARVYLAADLKHDRKVAIKLLPPELAGGANAERFLREIRITANLRHPNILSLIDSGAGDGLSWYVMPFVDGVSLRQRLAEGALPIDEAVELGVQVASALGHAHASDVVHRDLKPENIMFAEGHALVMDFGLARALTSDVKLTGTGMPLGTPAYMSPEQITGAAEADPRADLYSLACVVYEALTGRPPFTAPSVVLLLRAHMQEQPAPPSRLRPGIPAELDAVLLRMLAKQPEGRPGSAAEVVDVLTALLGDVANAVPPPPRRGAEAAGRPAATLWSRLFGRGRKPNGQGA